MRLALLAPLAAILAAGCVSVDPPSQTTDACALFIEKESWWSAVKRAERRWGAPPGYILAVIGRESSFNHKARPPRQGGFLFFPGKRPSSAFGYAQAQDPVWQEYRADSRVDGGADRDEFRDAADFVSWYHAKSRKNLGLGKTDFRAHYLAYHEGWGGYRRGTWRKKGWLPGVADQVARQARTYEDQIDRCDGRLNRMSLWPF